MPVRLCYAKFTTPNLPYPSFLPTLKSSTLQQLPSLLSPGPSLSRAKVRGYLLGGERESELLVEVGEPTCLNLYS